MHNLKFLLFPLLLIVSQLVWAAPVKILPLGDSITDGADYNPPFSSYRDELYDFLTDAGYSFEFVGTRSSDYNNIILNHDGVPSIRTDQILNGGLQQAPLNTKLTHYDIDIVLLHVGTNDIIQGLNDANYSDATTLAYIENIIDELQNKNPNVSILVAKVIPIYYNNTTDDESTNLNALIETTWAENNSTDTSKVIVVDQNTNFYLNDYSDAGVHPDQSGEDKMAQKWFETLVTQPILADQLLINPNLTLSAPQSTLTETNFTISTVSDSNGTITYASTTQDICTVNNTTVSPLMAGICTLTAEQEAGGIYTADTDTLNVIIIPKADQTITVTVSTSKQTAKLNTSFTISAVSSSGLTVFSFTSVTPKICMVNRNTVTTLAAGDCNLITTQAGDANYNSATSPIKTVTIIKNEQTLTFTTPNNAKVGSEFSIDAKASSALTVKIVSKTPNVCSVVANKTKPLTEGTCTLLASQAGNASFKPQTKEKAIMITKPEEKAGSISPIWLLLLSFIRLFQRRQLKTTD